MRIRCGSIGPYRQGECNASVGDFLRFEHPGTSEGLADRQEPLLEEPEIVFGRAVIEGRESGRRDSDPRPPGPKPGALTRLRYAPKEDLIIL